MGEDKDVGNDLLCEENSESGTAIAPECNNLGTSSSGTVKNGETNGTQLISEEKSVELCEGDDNINALSSDETVEEPDTGSSPDSQSDEISLHKAVKLGNYELVKKILTSTSVDVDMKDSENWSCLHEACIHNCQFAKIAELLLEHGADPNIKDGQGETPLHGAVLFHFTDTIKLLCKYKADFNVCNNEGVSSLDIAHYAEDVEVLEIFGQPTKRKYVKKNTPKRKTKRSVLRPRNSEDLNYIPSPLSSPSILKKRKRVEEEDSEDCVSPSPKKTIKFSGEDRYTPSSLYR